MNPFRHCGEYFDAETGNIYCRARYYDPNTGRFISEDTHWNPSNMIYGDNQNAVKYAIIDDEKVYFDRNGKIVGTKETKEHLSTAFEKLEIEDAGSKQDNIIRFFQLQRTPKFAAIMQSVNLYVYGMNNPIKYTDPNGESVTAVWGGMTWWLVGVDGPLPIGDVIFVIGVGVCVIADGIIYFAKGGKQNKRSSEYKDVSDEELDRRYKDPNTPKSEKQKIKTEQKARKTRHSSQKK